MSDHKHFERAQSAYNWSSFSPKKRAASECAFFDETVQKLTDAGKGEAAAKFEQLFLKSLAAKSRCASPMITGPARFPVERMRKYNEWERKATEAMYDFVKKVLAPPKEVRKEINYDMQEKEIVVNGVRVVQNTEENRLQLVFEGKPSEETRTFLKKNGYKWSPRNSAWQRQLTPNAAWNFNHVVREYLRRAA